MLRAALEEDKAHDMTDLRRAESRATYDIQLAWLDAKAHIAFAAMAAWTRVAEHKIQAWEAAQTSGIHTGAAAGPSAWQAPPGRAASGVPATERASPTW